MFEGIAEQVDGQLEDNSTALRSLHCAQRTETARLGQLTLCMNVLHVKFFFHFLRIES